MPILTQSAGLAVFPGRPDHQGPGHGDGMTHGTLLDFRRDDQAFRHLRELLVEGTQALRINPVIIGQKKSHDAPCFLP